MRYLSVCSGIEAASVAWSPLSLEAVAYSEIEPFACAVLAHHYPDVPNIGDMTQILDWRPYAGTVDLIVAGTPCQDFQSRGREPDWPESAVDWPWSLSKYFLLFVRSGLSGKMCPEFFQQTEDGTSGHSSGRWTTSGILARGECLTLNTSEFPRDTVESSLLDILETGDLPQRFFLSPTACAGILRRAEKRGRTLPKALREALERGAQTTTGHKPGSTSPTS